MGRELSAQGFNLFSRNYIEISRNTSWQIQLFGSREPAPEVVFARRICDGVEQALTASERPD